MKSIKLMLAGASLLLCCGCGMQVKESTTVTEKASNENAVIENMMSRRSIRKYKPQAVNRDTMQIIPVSYTHLRAHETGRNLVCRLLLEKKIKENEVGG